jgi:hypothetical protein
MSCCFATVYLPLIIFIIPHYSLNAPSVEGWFTDMCFLFGRCDILALLRVQSNEECPLTMIDLSSGTVLTGLHLAVSCLYTYIFIYI